MRLAIFDFDDTIVGCNSWHAFFERELRRRPGRAPLLMGAYLLRRARWWTGARLRDCTLGGLRGLSAREVDAIGESLYRDVLAARVRPAAIAEIERRRAAGFAIVLATGTFDFVVAPFARQVRADAVIATPVAFAQGRCLGTIATAERLGAAKAAAVTAHFSETARVDWAASCAYTDSLLDVPLLELVGERWLVTTAAMPPPGFPPDTRRCRWADA